MNARTQGFVDRYEAVGLTQNPFVAAQLPAAGDLNCEKLFVDRGLPAPPPAFAKSLVQVIGDSGLGKSTQLQQWRSTQPGPLHYIPRVPYRSRWSAPPRPAHATGTIYGDEIDRMPSALRAQWFRSLAQANITLIIATHRDLTSLGNLFGFEVITHILTPVDRAGLRSIVDRRMSAFATAPDQQQINLDDAVLDQVWQQSGGNPGAAEVVLHSKIAHLVQRGS